MNKEIVSYRFKEDLPIGFEIVSLADLYAKNRELLILPHRTTFYHIIWFQQGDVTHIVDFNPLKIKENTLVFLNKDIVQVYDPATTVKGKAILFTDTFFCQSEADVRFLKESILFNDLFVTSAMHLAQETTILAKILDLMEAEVRHAAEPYHSSILKDYLHTFLLHAERERRQHGFQEVKRGADLDHVLLFRDLLEKSFKEHKQVYFYATKLSVTEKRLSQAISKVLGKTAKQMIDDRVMLEAKRLLAHSCDSIKEIAYALGFEEPTNFIKYFRKHSRLTPVEFRETVVRGASI